MARPLHRFALLVTAAATLTLPAIAFAREKSDIIVLLNGDRITGEIIELRYGQLSVKTDSLGTVKIEWLDVARIESQHNFSVESNAGDLYDGGIASAPETGHIVVSGADGTVDLPVGNVARIGQLEAGFIERLRGSVSLGFNQNKASEVRSITFDYDAEYRSDKIIASLDANFTSTETEELGSQNQYSLTLANQFLRPGDKFWLALGSYESNEQQGIDGRLLIGAARGRHWLRRSDAEFDTFVGAGLAQEWAVDAADDQQSVEGLLGLQWKIFRLDHPETTLTSRLLVLPSFTESGRYRANTSISLRHEIVKDFYLDLSFNGAYDKEPPSAEADNVDYSVSTSLGYKF